MFFGRETNTGVKVVVKQYTMHKFRGIFREIKVFTHLEKFKNSEQGNVLRDILNTDGFHDGLPILLSYKLKQEGGEILMADAGVSLDKWGEESMNKK